VLLLVTSAAPSKYERASLKSVSHIKTWNFFSSSLNAINKTYFFTWVAIKQESVLKDRSIRGTGEPAESPVACRAEQAVMQLLPWVIL